MEPIIFLYQLTFSLDILLITIFFLIYLEPRYCSRCNHGTLFGKIQYLQNNPNFPLQLYCLRCLFWINLSEWKCDNCKCSGTHRIHELNFWQRFRTIRGKELIIPCGNCYYPVELIKV